MAANTFPILRGPDAQQSRTQDNLNQVLAPVARALQNTPIMGAPPPVWVIPTLLNGFAASAGYATPSFQVDALGYVHLRGVVANAAGCAAGTIIFALPLPARPGFAHLFASTDGAVTRGLTITAAGTVATSAILGAGAGLSLECVFQAGG